MAQDTRSPGDDRSIRLRLPRNVRELIERAAARSGMSVPAFIIDAAKQEAELAADPTRTTYLKPKAFKALIEALDRPPVPNEKLRAAFEQYRRTVVREGMNEPGDVADGWHDLFATAEVRARLSPAAIRALTGLAVPWNLTDADASALIGIRDSDWKPTKAGLWKDVLSQDQLTRASLLIGIYKHLHILFADDMADRWPRLANTHAVFGGRSPIEAMIAGGIPQMLEVRRYVAALAAGN